MVFVSDALKWGGPDPSSPLHDVVGADIVPFIIVIIIMIVVLATRGRRATPGDGTT